MITPPIIPPRVMMYQPKTRYASKETVDAYRRLARQAEIGFWILALTPTAFLIFFLLMIWLG